jgi:hypothetical protein
LNYDIIGQTYDIAVCRIVVVSPELTYDIIVNIKKYDLLRKKGKIPNIRRGVHRLEPWTF